MLRDELLAETLEPAVRASVSSAQRLCGRQRDSGSLGPFVHVGDRAREDDLGPGLHGGG